MQEADWDPVGACANSQLGDSAGPWGKRGGGDLGGDDLLQLQLRKRTETPLRDPGGRGTGTSAFGSLSPVACPAATGSE